MNSVTIVGNMTRDPEVQYTSSGNALTKFGIAVNTRRKDGDEWVDGDPQFFDVTVWGEYGENIAESLGKGDRVVVAGKLQFRSWEADDGSKRSKIEITAEEVAPSLRWATAKVTRTEKKGSSGGGRTSGRSSGGGGGFYDDEEPF